MAVQILASLRPELASAHWIVETLVVRSQVGAMYTIDVGESLLDGAANPFGAKVTLVGESSRPNQ